MGGYNLDRDEPLLPLPSNLSGNIGKLLDVLVPGPEDTHSLTKEALKGLIWSVQQPVGCKYTNELIIEVSGDSFNEGKSSSDGVRGELQFTVDVPENENEGFLNLIKVGGRKKLI